MLHAKFKTILLMTVCLSLGAIGVEGYHYLTKNNTTDLSVEASKNLINNPKNPIYTHPLIMAIWQEDKEKIQELIKNGQDVNQVLNNGLTPMHYAFLRGNYDIVELLFENEADINALGDIKLSPTMFLMMATQWPSYILDEFNLDTQKLKENLIKIVVKHSETIWSESELNINPNLKNENGETLMHLAIKLGYYDIAETLMRDYDTELTDNFNQTAFHLAVEKGYENLFSELNASDLSYLKNNYGETPLHIAIKNNYNYIFGPCYEIPTNTGDTPLSYAIIYDNKETFEALLDEYVKINIQNVDGDTPLHLAFKYKRYDFAETLIERYDIDYNIQNKQGETPLHLAIQNKQKDLAMLLIENGAEIDLKNNQNMTPLTYAVMFGDKELVELLIEKGADIKIQNHLPDDYIYSCCSLDETVENQTLLHFASQYLNLPVMKLLVSKGLDVNAKDDRGETPLFKALAQKSFDDTLFENLDEATLKSAQFLLDNGAALNILNKYSGYPVSNAIRTDKPKTLKYLISQGADIKKNSLDVAIYYAEEYPHNIEILLEAGATTERSDAYYYEQLHQAMLSDKAQTNTALHLAAKKGQMDKVQELIKSGADVNKTNFYGWTPLFFAIYFDHPDIALLLIEKGADVNYEDIVKNTPLHLSAKKGQKSVVESLLNQGAHVNHQNNLEKTPLHLAALLDSIDIVTLLVDKGADLTIKDNKGETALFYAPSYRVKIREKLLDQTAKENINNQPIDLMDTLLSDDALKMTPLHKAVKYGKIDEVKTLLKQGADIEALNDFGWSPIFFAVHYGNTDLLNLLIEKGAKLDRQDISGKTLLQWAVWNGYSDIAKMLLDKGLDINHKDALDHTPLFYAIFYGNLDMVKLLIENGADISMIDNKGQSYVHKAIPQTAFHRSLRKCELYEPIIQENYNNIPILKILLENGADVNVIDKKGRTPLDFAIFESSETAILLLLEKGAITNYYKQEDLDKILHPKGPEYETIRSYKSKTYNDESDEQKDINARDEDGKTQLYKAVEYEDYNLVERLFDEGADPYITDNSGNNLMDVLYRKRYINPSQNFSKLETFIRNKTNNQLKYNGYKENEKTVGIFFGCTTYTDIPESLLLELKDFSK